jgi:chromosome segregation ATPase
MQEGSEMQHLRALAVVAVVVLLALGTGCVTRQQYDRDIQVERAKTIQVMKERDQARIDLKKAHDTISDLTAQVAALAKVQDQLADERKRVESLQASIKSEVEKAKRAQEVTDRDKMGKLATASRNEASQLARAREQIVELRKQIDQLKRGEKETKPMAAPTPAATAPRVTPPAPPAPPPQ